MKQLTITIPAYNAGPYIEKCLDSFVGEGGFAGIIDGPDDRLEIIVINDGSTDNTKQLVEAYIKRYPSLIRLVNKQNGGHGSGINAGADLASGRFFKVVDADDWVLTENLRPILDALENTDADVIVTGYRSVNEETKKTQEYKVPAMTADMAAFADCFEQTPAAFQFHGLCYRTDFYRSLGLSLSEGVYYEDQEYAVLPFLKAEKIVMLPYLFYVYRLGRSDQSVNFGKMQKRLSDMQTVLKKLIRYHKEASCAPDWKPEQEQFFVKRLSIAATSYFAAALVKSGGGQEGRQDAKAFKSFLEAEEPEVAARVEGKYNTMAKAAGIPGLAGLYNSFSGSGMFKAFKKRWNR